MTLVLVLHREVALVSGGGLSGGEITGVVISVLVGIAALGAAGYFGLMFYKRRSLPSVPNIAFSNTNYENMDDIGLPA